MERDVPVREVMDREYVGVSESDGVQETAELLLEEGAETAVVLRGADPVGIVTERDAMAALVGETPSSATDAMTPVAPIIEPDASIAEAADLMSQASTKYVLVSDGDDMVGVVSEHDLITTAPFATRSVTPDVDEPTPATTGATDAVARAEAGDDHAANGFEGQAVDPAFEDQSICEVCGSLSRDLSPFNGQLLCPDCRDI